MWIIIALIVALIVALVVILVFNSSSTKASKNSQSTMDNAQTSVDAEMCKNLCDTCKRVYGTGCNWATFKGTKCAAMTSC